MTTGTFTPNISSSKTVISLYSGLLNLARKFHYPSYNSPVVWPSPMCSGSRRNPNWRVGQLPSSSSPWNIRFPSCRRISLRFGDSTELGGAVLFILWSLRKVRRVGIARCRSGDPVFCVSRQLGGAFALGKPAAT